MQRRLVWSASATTSSTTSKMMAVSAARFAALGALVGTALLPLGAAAAPAGNGATTSYSAAAALGKLMFFDQSLSASGKMSCASCHSPAHAYGPPNGLAAQLGGPAMGSQGTRAVPRLR